MKKIKLTSAFIFPLLLCLYEISIYLTNDAYLPALPALTHSFSVSHDLGQWTVSMWFLGSACIQFFLGPLSDHYGRRPILLSSGAAFLIATLVCATTHSFSLLLVARLIQGMAVPAMIVPGYAAIHESLDDNAAIQVLAWIGSITILAPALGPLFGAVVLQFAGWRWIFIALLAWAFITLIGLYKYMPETLSQQSHQFSLGKCFKDYFSIITNLGFLKRALMFCALFAALISWIAATPFILITLHHFTPIHFGLIQMLVFGCFIIGNRSVKRLMQALPTHYLANIGMVLAVLTGVALLILTRLEINTLMPFIIAFMALGLSAGISFPVLNRLAIAASKAPMGSRMAVFSTLLSASGAIGSVLVSAKASSPLLHLALVAGICTLMPLLLWLLPSPPINSTK